MKIVHFVSSLNIGGAEKLVCNLARQQEKVGNLVIVASFGSEEDKLCNILNKDNIKIEHIQGNYFKRIFLVLKVILSADIIHFHSGPIVRSLSSLFPIWFIKKVFYTVHGEVNPDLPLLHFSHKIMRPCFNKVVAVSRSSRTYLNSFFGWTEENIGLIRNGIQIPDKKVRALTGEKLRLGTVCRLIPLKNLQLIIQALSRFSAKEQANISLEVFGDGPLMDDLKSAALKISAEVNFHGFCLDETHIYSTMDILVISSDTEGLPMVLIEAMARSKPVISTRVGAIPDIIENNISGLLIEAKNEEQLYLAIKDLYHNTQKSQLLGENGYERILTDYSIEAVAEKYHQLYLGQ